MKTIQAPTRRSAQKIYDQKRAEKHTEIEVNEFADMFRETRLAGYVAFEKLVHLYDEIPEDEIKARAGILTLIIKSRNDLLSCDSTLHKNKMVADIISAEVDTSAADLSRWNKFQELAK